MNPKNSSSYFKFDISTLLTKYTCCLLVCGQLPWFLAHPAVFSLYLQHNDIAHFLPLFGIVIFPWKEFILAKGVVTSVYLVEAPVTGIKMFDWQNFILIIWSTWKYCLDHLILKPQPIDFLTYICHFKCKSNSNYVWSNYWKFQFSGWANESVDRWIEMQARSRFIWYSVLWSSFSVIDWMIIQHSAISIAGPSQSNNTTVRIAIPEIYDICVCTQCHDFVD